MFVSCGTYESSSTRTVRWCRSLQATGMEVRYVEARDGHNWENWRDRLRDGLSWLIPGPLWRCTSSRTMEPSPSRRSWPRSRRTPCTSRACSRDSRAEFAAGDARRWGPAHHLDHLRMTCAKLAVTFRAASRLPAHATGRSRRYAEVCAWAARAWRPRLASGSRTTRSRRRIAPMSTRPIGRGVRRLQRTAARGRRAVERGRPRPARHPPSFFGPMTAREMLLFVLCPRPASREERETETLGLRLGRLGHGHGDFESGLTDALPRREPVHDETGHGEHARGERTRPRHVRGASGAVKRANRWVMSGGPAIELSDRGRRRRPAARLARPAPRDAT